jgi:hypothetical protein
MLPSAVLTHLNLGDASCGSARAGYEDLVGTPGLGHGPEQATPSLTAAQDGSRLRLVKIEIE